MTQRIPTDHWTTAHDSVCGALAAPSRDPSACYASPSDLFGKLFVDVQLRRIFPDGKMFADAEPRRPIAAILCDHRKLCLNDDALRSFVHVNFVLPATETDAHPDLPTNLPLIDHIRNLWTVLTRPPSDSGARGSELPLACPFVVPGGRFREIYYWDSYYTMLGLRCDGRSDLIEGLVGNFTELIERFGRIPNGTRTYYLSRSQPPHYALMVDLLDTPDIDTARRQLAAMRLEHEFWMSGSNAIFGGASARVVRLPDGAILNRYWDDRDGPREESMFEDLLIAAASSRPHAEICRDLRATAESGWDFSSRWFGQGHGGGIAAVRTTRIIPIDLNCLLYASEQIIAKSCQRLEMPEAALFYGQLAAKRRTAIRRWLWDVEQNRFGDLDIDSGGLTSSVNAAVVYALFTGVATQRQAAAVAKIVREHLLAPGGLRTTLVESGEQWDAPNGWAPLQWAAIEGLKRYGYAGLARRVASRWLSTVCAEFGRSGRLLEKYDVEQRRPGGGGEYPLQDGFGWTNGVVAALLQLHPELTSMKTDVRPARPE